MRRAVVLGALLAAPFENVAAVGLVELEVGELVGFGWRAEALSATVEIDDPPAGGPPLTVGIGALELLGVELHDLRLECSDGVLQDTGLECRRATLVFAGAAGAQTRLPVELRLARDRFFLHTQTADASGVTLSAKAEGRDGAWRASIFYRVVGPKAASALLRTLLDGSRPDVESGQAELELQVSGGQGLARGTVVLRFEDLSLSDASGLNAGEQLSLTAELSFAGGPDWELSGSLVLGGGGVFISPWFITADPHPIFADFSARYTARYQSVEVQSLSVRHPGVLTANAGASMSLTPTGVRVDALALSIPRQRVGPLHQHYLAPWLSARAFDDIAADGEFALDLDWRREGASALALGVQGVSVRDSEDRFALSNLSGEVHWRQGKPAQPTRLGWDGVKVYAFELGAAELDGELYDTGFRLSAPLRLPILDGSIEVAALDVEQLFSDQAVWRLSGTVGPVSMQEVSRTLGWPRFSGTLSGTIMDARYTRGRLTLGGDVRIKAFDGHIGVHGLELEDPFGLVPKLRADLVFSDISLGSLTDTFYFGSIEGRLEGRVDDLVLEDWQPRSFDARFATPPKDSSRRRISQRAIESLSEIGGAGKVLSSTLLRLFDEFSYARLGLSCRLERGVCEMGGVEPAPRGYYIVKGGGSIPRIDVVGFNERVDWNTLIDRLKGATSLPTPIVQ